MARLIVHVEGVTEEDFVNTLLAPHLLAYGWARVAAFRMGRARSRERRHGIKGWDVARDGIIRHLRGDPGCCVTTMVDYYGLPETGSRAWPGRVEADTHPFDARGDFVQRALHEDVARELGGEFAARRFVPFVIMHEFEALLFSDCVAFSAGIGRPDLAQALQEIRDQFATPEEINDSPTRAPSKRIAALVPGYEKPLLGVLAALQIGLPTMRAECPHFRSWLKTLEAW
ncbi:MAG: DUF4276 family protein [Anaerolineae bacterium]